MEAPIKVSKSLSMDEVLPLIGEFGKYQILFDIALCVMTIPDSMLMLIPYFTQYNPPWKCSRNSTVCSYNGTFGAYDTLYESRCKMPRSEWEYTQPKDYSIITQFDLYCDREAYSHLATTLFFVSYGVGAFVLGYLSDRFGRKRIMVPSLSAIVLFGFLTAFSPNLPTYILAKVLVGFFIPGGSIQMFLLISEYVGPKWRPFAAMMLWVSYSSSVVALGVIAYLVRTWKMLTIVTTAPFFLCIVFFKFIPESTRWLNVNRKTDELMKILKTIARVNGKELPDIKLEEVKHDSQFGLYHYKDLFRPMKIAKRSLIQGYTWIVCGLVFYGVSYAADDLGGSIYRDYILATLLDFPGVATAIYLCNKIGRKYTALFPMLVSGIALISVSIIPLQSEMNGLMIFRLIIGLIGKFSISLAFDSIYTWSTELYPTVTRGAGMGYLQIAARIGSALAPWVAKWLIVVHVVLPFSLMGGSAVICAILLYWLPETAKKETMETLHDQFDENENKNLTLKICSKEESNL